MTEILVLLGLLSVATLAARRGYAGLIAHFVTTPLLLGTGVVLAALGFLTSSTDRGTRARPCASARRGSRWSSA